MKTQTGKDFGLMRNCFNVSVIRIDCDYYTQKLDRCQ